MPVKGKKQIPTKALLDGEIAFKKKGAKAKGQSAHGVRLVHFNDKTGILDKHGQPRVGFFKPLSYEKKSYYPALLAKLSVGISALYRMTLGERAAEERLVYNAEGDIVGTVSLALDGFVPMQTTMGEPITDKTKRELANPSTLKLIERGATEVLVYSWLRKERDLHPDNIGTGNISVLLEESDGSTSVKEIQQIVRLDWDNSHSNITDPIRGKRGVQGFMTEHSHNASKLSKEQLEKLPELDTREHWPTHVPQHGALYKIYQSQKAFEDLGGRSEFNAQKHFALLKSLLAYQPDVMQTRLTTLLGDTKLNLSELPEANLEELFKDNIPYLFYRDIKKPHTPDNELTVVEHLMRNEEQYFNERYRIIVKQYKAFNEYLVKHPEAFQEAYDWFKAQNELHTLQAHSETEREKELTTVHPFDLDKLENQYMKIWQDAALTQIFDALKPLKSILTRLQAQIDLKSKMFHWQPPPEDAFDIIEQAPNLIDNTPEDEDERMALQSEIEQLKQALSSIAAFYQYSKEKAENHLENDLSPTPEANKRLVDEWSAIWEKTKETVETHLKKGKLKTTCTDALTQWQDALHRINYECHLQDRTTKQEEAETGYHYQWELEEEEEKTPAHIKHKLTYPSPDSAKRITDALVEWLDHCNHSELIKTCRHANTEYQSQLGSFIRGFWGGSRDIGSVLDKASRQTNYNLLRTIFKDKDAGWDTNSYNTILMKKLLRNMKDQTSFKFKAKHPIIAAIEVDDINNHLGFLKKEIIKRFKDPAAPKRLSVA